MVLFYKYLKWKWVITLKLVLTNTYLVDFCQQLPVQTSSIKETFITVVLCRTIATKWLFNFSSCNSWFSGLCTAGIKTLFELKHEICSFDLGRHSNTFKLLPRQRWNSRQLDRVVLCLNVVRLWSLRILLTYSKGRKSRDYLASSQQTDLHINFLWSKEAPFLSKHIFSFPFLSFFKSSSILVTLVCPLLCTCYFTVGLLLLTPT